MHENAVFHLRVAHGRLRILKEIAIPCLGVALLVLAIVPVASASPAAPPSAGVWFQVPGGGQTPAPMLATEVRIHVAGPVARAEVIQRFRNTTTTWLEGYYVFPLPERAAVDRFRLRVGNREIEGRILEREAARAAYRQGRAQGRRSALVEQERPNLFTSTLANVAPGEEISVVLAYQQRLDYRDGRFSLRLPLVVAPRYVPGGAGETAPAVLSHRPVEAPANPVRIQVDLDAGVAVDAIDSLYHAVHVERTGVHRYRVTLVADAVPADRDFVLHWRPRLDDRPKPAIFQETAGGETYTLLTVYPPDLAAAGQVQPPRDLVFVVDVSGSMAGASLAQARAAVAMALARLAPDDRFNVVAFNDYVTAFHPDVRPATPEAVAEALAFVGRLKADGGTEIRPAIEYVLAATAPPDRLRQIIFLTDGAVGNEAELFRLIRERLGRARLFTVGIGSAPNAYFMREAARLGRGSYTYIGDIGEIQARVSALLAKLSRPAFVDIELDLPPGVEALPAPLPDLYHGELLTAVLRSPAPLPDIGIRGRFAEADWATRIDLDTARQSPGVRIAWAREAIATLMARYHGTMDSAARARHRREVVAISLRHQIMSRFTSFVAVDVTPARTSTALQKAVVPISLPRGWVPVIGMPQTATDSWWHVIWGMCFTVLAMLAAAAARRGRVR